MEATRNEYLLASVISELVSRAKTIKHHNAYEPYNYPERYTLEYDSYAVDLLLQFCNEYATSINSDLWVSIPTEAEVELKNSKLKKFKEEAEREGN